MSTRDNQKKYDDKSNVDSSIYSRVNIGQGANNKFDGPNLAHSGGSMNNPDERVNQGSSSLATVIYYAVGSILSALLIFAGMQIFRDYFYGEGLNQVIPSLLLLFGSFAIGFSSAKWIMKKFVHFKKS
ncbi:hypothetical protein [Trichococcus ilyis]|uniref:Uncharacterized protein n=1 Tax=Trichococcus ilyis TaxID=640938 RepID=A0A143Z8R1_9LACT|nr:hypothetical protein [Trichococcus ilyis]CZR07021.1 Hypothetical protein TR210_2388 [Trichococcus ilyis]SEJ90891.1 hypothetical protein SAMN05216375_13720 [Trichococcus ilyis]